ncbi:hypothetical protein CYMTET_44614 [Cymbomonas tetramitiformis]|uniref:Uncharacterized protein n=1 Tax=Cymbomonas tetramitiformis TaxID=36881 RepID=A0AAE0C0Z6_9CHLO|nr:hypothetical protein CYMTET_44614 [Cymbomonas tetramitiformis]
MCALEVAICILVPTIVVTACSSKLMKFVYGMDFVRNEGSGPDKFCENARCTKENHAANTATLPGSLDAAICPRNSKSLDAIHGLSTGIRLEEEHALQRTVDEFLLRYKHSSCIFLKHPFDAGNTALRRTAKILRARLDADAAQHTLIAGDQTLGVPISKAENARCAWNRQIYIRQATRYVRTRLVPDCFDYTLPCEPEGASPLKDDDREGCKLLIVFVLVLYKLLQSDLFVDCETHMTTFVAQDYIRCCNRRSPFAIIYLRMKRLRPSVGKLHFNLQSSLRNFQYPQEFRRSLMTQREIKLILKVFLNDY